MSTPGAAVKRVSPPPAERVSSPGEPSATRWPPSMMATRSQSRSASSMAWVVRMYGRPPLLQADDDLPGGEPGVGVHPRGGLVEEHDLGLADQRQGQRQPLLLAARRGAGPACRPTGRRPTRSRSTSGLLVVGVVGGEQPQRLQRPDPGVQAALLEHHPDAGRQGRSGRGAGRARAPRAVPASGAAVALQDLHRRRLAGAVGAEQPEHLAPVDGERQPVHRQVGAVGLLQPVDRDRRPVRLRHLSRGPATPGAR